MILVLDIETTGTDPQRDEILEVGWIVVRPEWPELPDVERGSVVLRTNPILASTCAPAVRRMHTVNGLWDEASSDLGVSLRVAEDTILDSILPHSGSFSLAGAGVHFDREFIKVHMPRLASLLSYWAYDSSVLHRTFRAVMGFVKDPGKLDRDSNHRALPDCQISLERLRAYARWIEDAKAALG